MTRAARFSQADLTRAIKACEKAGVQASYEISPDGTIRILTGKDRAANDGENPLDRVL